MRKESKKKNVATVAGAIVLKDYQRKVQEFLLSSNHRGVLALYSTGAGKSLTAIATACSLLKEKIVEHVVVLVKKSILDQFKKEILRFDPSVDMSRFIITTAETFLLHTVPPPPESTFLIVDEAHNYINPEGKVVVTMHDYAIKCAKLLFLTATIFVNDAYDIVPITCMIKQVPIVSRSLFVRTIESSLADWLKDSVSYYLVDKNTLPNYPKVTFHEISIPMNDGTRDFMLRQESAESGKKKKPFYMEERQHSLGLASLGDSIELLRKNCEKCKWMLAQIPLWLSRGEGKIVIYSAFIDKGTDILRRMMLDMGINCVIIDGETSAIHRKKVMEIFNRPLSGRKTLTYKKKAGDVCGAGNAFFIRTTLGDPKEKKYSFSETDGTEISLTQEQQSRLKDLVIPPAWTPATVCRDNIKLLWGAKDKKGRTQRKYSKYWELQIREGKKMELLKLLTSGFWEKFHTTLDADIGAAWTENKLYALAAKLMSLCFFRVGGNEKEEVNSEDTHYGVTTMLKKHAHFDPLTQSFHFRFIGKSGKENACVLPATPALAEFRKLMVKSNPEDPLFSVDGIAITAAGMREYFVQKELPIRPKDFRTYHANWKFLDELCAQSELPVHITNNTRKKYVDEAIKKVAKDLNNTPVVSKSSYVFAPLWILYLTHPVEFQTISHNPQLKTTADKLVEFTRTFLSQKLDWTLLLKEYNENYGLASFSNQDIHVLVITDAGSESLDLKGVRHLILLDSIWNKATEDQIIGRGQRYLSHAHLPPSERNMQVWKLILDYADGKSPERKIFEIVQAKKEKEEQLYDVLKRISI